MTAVVLPPPELFLRDDVIRGGMDLLFFAHSRHLLHADKQLSAMGLGRAHHRVLYFVARKPDMTVGELLGVLGITKQSFGRVANQLMDKDLLVMRAGERDRRQRLLRLSPTGAALEHDIYEELRGNMARAYAASGGAAVAGYWTVLQHLMGDEARAQFSAIAAT